MNYWIVRGDPRQNQDFTNVHAGDLATWHTKVPPRLWKIGHRVLLWASYPRSELIALAEFLGETGKLDDDGETLYTLRYLSSVAPRALRQSELRADPALSNAIFLKRGPATSVLRSSISEGEHLYRLLLSKNPSINGVWPDLQALSSDVADVDQSAIEGSPLLVTHIRKERNLNIIEAKKAQVLSTTGKLECEACSFDFRKRYGALGEGYCEVHHLKPLGEASEPVRTFLDDLAILCSNCHRMIHRSGCTINIIDLRSQLENH